MLDLLLGLLEVLLEFFFEAAFELAAEAMTDLILRGLVAAFDNSEFTNPFLAYVGYIFLGGLSGGFSVLAFPHPFVHPSRIPGMSLVVSPVLTGLAMWFLGSLLRKSGKKVMRIRKLWLWLRLRFGDGAGTVRIYAQRARLSFCTSLFPLWETRAV